VLNRKAFVFKGSNAQIISLNESPTNLIEVIAKSGGIENELKAYKIKIIRGDLKNPEIIKVDLSTLEGLRNAELIIQANDIVYIEERYRIASELLTEITPILTIATTLTTIILLITNLQR
jgi:polysaccharide export outer membrane protein